MSSLEELIIDGELRTDDDFVGRLFGSSTVVGWNGRMEGQTSKRFILRCSVCAEDIELFKGGYFITTKHHLLKGHKPCGCSGKFAWTEHQYKIRASRSAKLKGVRFIGWASEYKKSNFTKVLLECPVHGEYSGSLLCALLDKNYDSGCNGCKAVKMGDFKRKDDEVMIKRFMESGFPSGTIFTRSSRLDKNGHKKYWNVYCPECETHGEGHIVGLYKGSRCCKCSHQRPQETYINLVMDDSHTLAIKFGVANISSERIKSQNLNSVYSIINYGVWTYPDIQSCKAAERTCMHSMTVGVLSKYEMADGYTETTFPSNIEHVIRIFEEHGGVRNI